MKARSQAELTERESFDREKKIRSGTLQTFDQRDMKMLAIKGSEIV